MCDMDKVMCMMGHMGPENWGYHLDGGHQCKSGQSVTPLDSDCILSLQDFDRLLEALRAALTKDPGTGFVFSCLSGQGRTTTAMVVAVLTCWHIGVGVAFWVRSDIIPGKGGDWRGRGHA